MQRLELFFPDYDQQFELIKLDLRRKYQVLSIEHNSGIVRYEIIDGIDAALLRGPQYSHVAFINRNTF